MSDLQWKIEDGRLFYLWKRHAPPDKWCEVSGVEAAAILLADRAATQEKCAQVADDIANEYLCEVKPVRAEKGCWAVASAIRSLNLETGK